ncbi:unnamed protein product, partial [Scytosiphon promiscuus]
RLCSTNVHRALGRTLGLSRGKAGPAAGRRARGGQPLYRSRPRGGPFRCHRLRRVHGLFRNCHVPEVQQEPGVDAGVPHAQEARAATPRSAAAAAAAAACHYRHAMGLPSLLIKGVQD